MATTLLDRARVLLAASAPAVAALGAVTLHDAGAQAQQANFILDSTRLEKWNDNGGYGGFWEQWSNPPALGITVETGADALKIFGSGPDGLVATIDSLDFEALDANPDTGATARLVFSGSGSILSPIVWYKRKLPTEFEFGQRHTEGLFALHNTTSSFALFDAQNFFVGGVGSGFGPPYPVFGPFNPGGFGVGFRFVDRFNGDVTAAVELQWELSFEFSWENTGTGELSLIVPPTGIDLALQPECPADFTRDEEYTFDDIQLFVTLYNSEDVRADINEDGEWTFDDVQAFIAAYNAGC